MKLIVDNKIPFIRQALEALAVETVWLPGHAFTPQAVREADALIVRTRTRCDRRLLEGSRVRFIATATIGTDHIDTRWCRRAGIVWANAPGCNAASVAQYVRSSLLVWQQERGIPLSGLTLGIVGVGHVGSLVAQAAAEMGMRLLLCDPKLPAGSGCSLSTIARESDIVTFHVPLLCEGRHPTFHMADETFFRALQRRPLLINTSRGEVVDTAALLAALRGGRVSDAVIDVWEHEPDIDRTLLSEALIGTPHIAGYSADGKANATRMALESLCRFFRLPPPAAILPPPPPDPLIEARSLGEAYLRMYDPRCDSRSLKARPELFEQLRGNYPLRREPQAYTVKISG